MKCEFMVNSFENNTIYLGSGKVCRSGNKLFLIKILIRKVKIRENGNNFHLVQLTLKT